MMRYRILSLLYCVAFASSACGDDGGDDGTSADGSGSETTTGADTGTLSGSASQSTTMTTEPTTTSESSTGTETGPGTDSETAGSECADHGEEACTADRACMGIYGKPYVVTGGGAGTMEWCFGPPEYFGCIPSDTPCTEAEAIMCEGDDAPPYWFPNGCTPELWFPCEPPTNADVEDCP